MTTTLPLAPIRRIMTEAGCKRVSEDAVALMAKYAESTIYEVSAEAKHATEHAGRNTVRVEDIEFVI